MKKLIVIMFLLTILSCKKEKVAPVTSKTDLLCNSEWNVERSFHQKMMFNKNHTFQNITYSSNAGYDTTIQAWEFQDNEQKIKLGGSPPAIILQLNTQYFEYSFDTTKPSYKLYH